MRDRQIIERIADDVLDVANEASSEQIEEQFKINTQELKVEATRYIKIFEELRQQVKDFENVLRRQSQLRKSFRDTYETIDEYIENKNYVTAFLNSDIPKKLYSSSFNFQAVLNNYLGQKVVMVYVFDDGSGPELYEINSEDILKFDYSSRSKLIARYNATTKDIGSTLTKLKLDEKFNFNYPNLKATYKETIYRYRCARKKNFKVVLWQVPDKVWHATKVSAEGDINEAYAGIVILNRTQPSFNSSNLEVNIGQFLKEVEKVDNISGLLQGDITKGNIEYGVKSAQASALSLNQIIKLAYEIVSDENYSKEKLLQKQEQFRKKGRTRNRITNMVDKDLEDLLSAIKIES